MEVVHLPGMALVDRPRLTATEHSGKHYRFVDLDLCLRGDASSVPHILVESAEGPLALAILVLMSSSMTTVRESVLPRYVNLSTNLSLCTLTEMLGST